MMKQYKINGYEKLEKLRAAVKLGDDQITRGEGIVYTQDRLNHITAKAFDNAMNGKKVNSDIKP